jgi:DNA-binding HxlR family transcriptional regulator
VVVRRILNTRPFTVQYSLSASGEDLKPVLEALGSWGTKWLPEWSLEHHEKAAPEVSTSYS